MYQDDEEDKTTHKVVINKDNYNDTKRYELTKGSGNRGEDVTSYDRQRDPIAIIGLSCRFPGAKNAEEYWQLLCDGVDAITEVPASRWENAQLLSALLEKHPTGTIYVAWDNADIHQDDEIEEVVRAAGCMSSRASGPTLLADVQPLAQSYRNVVATFSPGSDL